MTKPCFQAQISIGPPNQRRTLHPRAGQSLRRSHKISTQEGIDPSRRSWSTPLFPHADQEPAGMQRSRENDRRIHIARSLKVERTLHQYPCFANGARSQRYAWQTYHASIRSTPATRTKRRHTEGNKIFGSHSGVLTDRAANDRALPHALRADFLIGCF